MSFQVAYIPIGVGTFHLESAQNEFEKSIQLLKSLTEDGVYPDKMLLTLDDLNEVEGRLGKPLLVADAGEANDLTVKLRHPDPTLLVCLLRAEHHSVREVPRVRRGLGNLGERDMLLHGRRP